MTTPIIEKVARALYCAENGIRYEDNMSHVESWLDRERCAALGEDCMADEYEAMARAAIEALMEPTEEMREAALETPGMKALASILEQHRYRGGKIRVEDFNPPAVTQAWQAMLTAALNPQPLSTERSG